MNRNLICAVIASILTVACAGNTNQARSDFEYLDESLKPVYRVPEGVQMPSQYPDYDIPKVEQRDDNVLGQDVLISAPIQVLTIVDGSMKPQGEERRASIEFDVSSKVGENPVNGIWESLSNYLERSGLTYQSWDKEQGVLITDWVSVKKESDPEYFFGLEDYILGQSEETEVRARYSFNLDLSRSGRAAKLSADMTNFEQYVNGKLTRSVPNQIERDNFTVNLLNQVVKQYQNDIVARREDKIKKRTQSLALSYQVDRKDLASINVSVPFDQAWDSMESVFEQAGMEVVDRDRIQATYFVDIEGDWNVLGLFGSNSDTLDIESGEYKVFLGDRGDMTSITIFNDDNKPVNKADMSKIYNVLKSVIDSQSEK